jgi:hypothetical protein
LDKLENEPSEDLDDVIHVLFESTAISSGYQVRNPKKFAQKMQKVVKKSLGMAVEEKIEDKEGYSEATPPETEIPEIDVEENESHDEL